MTGHITELDAVRLAAAVMRATGVGKVRIPEDWLTGDLPSDLSWYYDLGTGELVVRLSEPDVEGEVVDLPAVTG